MPDWRIRVASLQPQQHGAESACSPSPLLAQGRWIDWDEAGLAPAVLAAAVLNGSLDLDWGQGSRTGAEAAAVLAGDWRPPAPRHELAARSLMAVRLAAQIPFPSSAEVSRWLYDFGVSPLCPGDARSKAWRKGLIWTGDRARLERHYDAAVSPVWESWFRRGQAKTAPLYHKLYVSPADAALDHVLHETLGLLLDRPAPAFKLVLDRQSARRPDKLIVYFESAAARDAWAGCLAERLAGCAGQGVPFTNQRDDLIALSTAEDPAPWRKTCRPASWRSWCCDRLGWMLQQARAAHGADLAPWEVALFSLSLEAVDLSCWARSGRALDTADTGVPA